MHIGIAGEKDLSIFAAALKEQGLKSRGQRSSVQVKEEGKKG